MIPTPDLIARTNDATLAALMPLIDADWSVPARDLEWSCHYTAAHLADDYFAYAGQLIAQRSAAYLPVEYTVDKSATPQEVLAVISTGAEVLRMATAAAEPSRRGWHPLGTADAGGFVAMGAVEGIVHTYDIAGGLGADWRPATELCRPVLERIFPDAPDGDPTDVLLWCTGRAALGDRPRLTQWRWWSAVRG